MKAVFEKDKERSNLKLLIYGEEFEYLFIYREAILLSNISVCFNF